MSVTIISTFPIVIVLLNAFIGGCSCCHSLLPINDSDPIKRRIQELVLKFYLDPRIVFLHRLSARSQMSPFFPVRTHLGQEIEESYGISTEEKVMPIEHRDRGSWLSTTQPGSAGGNPSYYLFLFLLFLSSSPLSRVRLHYFTDKYTCTCE